jgi:hypothetical protein
MRWAGSFLQRRLVADCRACDATRGSQLKRIEAASLSGLTRTNIAGHGFHVRFGPMLSKNA